jgi:small-conductance mechanosensitive channel
MLDFDEWLSYINYQSDFFFVGILLIILGVILFFVVHRLRIYLIARAEKTETKWDDILVASVGKPMMLIALFVPIYYGITLFIVTPAGSEKFMMSQLPEVAFIILCAWFLSAFIRKVMEAYGRKHVRGTSNDMGARLLGLVDLLAVYIIWFMAFLMILGVYEINLTPFIAGLGIAGIAVALAAQDMLGNFFGGAMIYADRPFKIGDRVKLDDNVGDVLDIGLRSTRIKTLDNELMTIPNSIISKSIITNYALPDLKIKIRLPYCVSPCSDISKVKQILFEVAQDASKKFEYILEDPKPEVFLLEIQEHRLELMVTFWSNRFDRKWESRDFINCEVLRRFREEEIELPVPQRKLYIRDKTCVGVPAGGLGDGDEIDSFESSYDEEAG